MRVCFLRKIIQEKKAPGSKAGFLKKKHEENLTGTERAYKPSGSLKSDSKQNIKKYETWKI